jgi:hypothetical protein
MDIRDLMKKQEEIDNPKEKTLFDDDSPSYKKRNAFIEEQKKKKNRVKFLGLYHVLIFDLSFI